MTSSPIRAPFDPSDPFDAVSDDFRRQVVDMALRAMDDARYRDFNATEHLSALIGGVLTGLIQSCYAAVYPEAREQVMAAISSCLPLARDQAVASIQEGEKIQ